MTDISLTYDAESGFDIAMDGTDLRTESGLRNAVLLSLFTDRRAANDDPLPDGTTDRRGCWMDMFSDHIKGSRLWVLQREKQTDDVLRRAKTYSEESLQWLVDLGIATSVTVTAEWLRTGVLALQVVILLPGNTPFSDVFNYPLQAA